MDVRYIHRYVLSVTDCHVNAIPVKYCTWVITHESWMYLFQLGTGIGISLVFTESVYAVVYNIL